MRPHAAQRLLRAALAALLLTPHLLLLSAPLQAQPRRAAKARTGLLEIRSSTRGATVSVDGEEVGEVPLPGPIEVEAGERVVKVSLRGHIDYYETHRVKPGKRPTIVEADLLPWAGIVLIQTEPSGAQVLIDGQLLGETPFDGEVEEGEREVTVQAPGYVPWRLRQAIVAGATLDLDLRLEPEPTPEPEAPFYATWWFWTGVAAALAGGTAAAFLLSGDDPAPPPQEPVDGTLHLNLTF